MKYAVCWTDNNSTIREHATFEANNIVYARLMIARALERGEAPARGLWRSAAGSTVVVSGEHDGIYSIVFDWVEEGACFEAKRAVVVDILSKTEGRLSWRCDCHGSHDTPLYRSGDLVFFARALG